MDLKSTIADWLAMRAAPCAAPTASLAHRLGKRTLVLQLGLDQLRSG